MGAQKAMGLRIAQIFPEYVPRKLGFIEEYLFAISEESLRQSAENIFIFSDSPSDFVLKEFEARHARVVVIKPEKRNSIKYSFRIIKAIKEEEIDVADFHFGDDVGVIVIAAWLRIFNKNIKIVRHQHNVYGKKKHFVFVQKVISRLKIVGMVVHKIVAVSYAIKGDLIFRNIAENKVIVIHNGINIARYSYSEEGRARIKNEFGISGKEALITSIAYARKEKGLEYLIAAIPLILKQNPCAKFMIVGGGPLTESLKKQAYEAGVADSVIFTGVRRDIPDILSATDVSVLASLNEGFGAALEGFGAVIIESMACKRPVVASKLDAILEIVSDGESGLLVNPKDVDGIAAAINRLLGDRNLSDKLGEEGLMVVKSRFSKEKMAKETVNLYLNLFREIDQ